MLKRVFCIVKSIGVDDDCAKCQQFGYFYTTTKQHVSRISKLWSGAEHILDFISGSFDFSFWWFFFRHVTDFAEKVHYKELND